MSILIIKQTNITLKIKSVQYVDKYIVQLMIMS